VDRSDPVGQVVAQLSSFTEGLHEIKTVLASGLNRSQATAAVDPAETTGAFREVTGQLASFAQHLEQIRNVLADGLRQRSPSAEQSSDNRDAALQVIQQLNSALEGIKAQLGEAVQKQNQHASFRLIDPSSPADYQITDVSRQTLAKIWALIEQERKGTQGESPEPSDRSDRSDKSD
jgi:ABC-type transporter Mla subunit MlaD